MHIFNILITSLQSFKLIAYIPLEELIKETYYPTLKSYLKIVYVENAVIFDKFIFFVCKKSYAYLQ